MTPQLIDRLQWATVVVGDEVVYRLYVDGDSFQGDNWGIADVQVTHECKTGDTVEQIWGIVSRVAMGLGIDPEHTIDDCFDFVASMIRSGRKDAVAWIESTAR